MILNLTSIQRLNLMVILDGYEPPQESPSKRKIGWDICKLQEKIDLSEEDKKSIKWRKEVVVDDAGRAREFVLWEKNVSLPDREVDLSDNEIDLLCKALDKYPVVMARDKSWWVPLNMQLPEPTEQTVKQPVNGPPQIRQ